MPPQVNNSTLTNSSGVKSEADDDIKLSADQLLPLLALLGLIFIAIPLGAYISHFGPSKLSDNPQEWGILRKLYERNSHSDYINRKPDSSNICRYYSE